MKPWADVEQSAEFQSLSDQDKSRAQSEYFDDVVVPQLEQRDIEPARSEFFTQFNRSYLPKDSGQSQGSSAVNQAVQSLAQVGTGTVEGLGKFGESYVRNLNPVGIAAHLGVPGAQSLVDAYASVPASIAGGADTAEKAVEEAVPVNPLYADTMPVKAAGVGGQAVGQLATVLTGASFTKAPRILQALGLGLAGAMEIDSGYEEADRLGVTNPWQRDLLALTYAAAGAGVEGMGGFGSPSFMRALTGEIRDTLMPGLVRGAKTALSEGAEEPITGTIQDVASNAFATEDPNRPGYALNGQPLPSLDITQSDFWKKRGEEFALGTLGGTVFAGAELAGSRPKIEEAKKLQQKAQLTLAVMEQKPDLTPEEQQDLQDLQQHEANLATFIQAAEDTSQTASVAAPQEMPEVVADPDVAMTAAAVSEEPTIETTDEIETEIQPEPILEPTTAEVADSGLTGSEAAVEQPSDLPTLTQEVNAALPTPEISELAPVSQTPSTSTKADNPVMGKEGYRVTDTGKSDEYRKRGGWKLHLAVSPENYKAVDEWLFKNHKGQYKLLQGGDPGHSDFTIYSGSKADADAFSERLNNEIGDLLNAPELDGDRAFGPKVGGRFDVQRTGTLKDVPWQSYGREGIPGTGGDWGTQNQYIALARARKEGDLNEVARIEKELDRQFSLIEKQITERYGDFYTGKPSPEPQGQKKPVAPSEAKIEEAWLASPEFAQAEELAAAGDIEAAEALEASFREKQAQTAAPAEIAPEAKETAPAAVQIKNSRPVELNVITKSGLGKQTVEATEQVKRSLIDQKKLYTKLLNCLNS